MESFDPRCIRYLYKHYPQIIRGQLAENAVKRNKSFSWPVRFLCTYYLENFLTRPDFIAYRFEDRGNLSLRLCRGFYKVQEASWTVRDRETMEKAEAAGNLVIFEHFDPRG